MADNWLSAERGLIAGSTTTEQDHSLEKKPRVGCQLVKRTGGITKAGAADAA